MSATFVRASERFEALYALEYQRLVAIARRVVRDRADAEDVAQEVFASFVRRGRPQEASVGWLRTAAVHVALNLLRERRRRNRREESQFRLERPLHDPAREGDDPQTLLDRCDRNARVRSAMQRIDPRHAEILALRYGGLSYCEIADALSVGVAQVGTRLSRAERAFKKEIEREAS
ncbi:MAG: sigma-70 family RNA polymerase sigma factor [Candidatus Eremiobacteraeota bacterium]|nr:sigma-70 family RNA polymerase sigma factor [Candidatus Eremiobacteraeota bacterium]